MAIAQIRYEGDGTWTLYFGDRNGKWIMYFDLDTNQPIDVILDEIGAGPHRRLLGLISTSVNGGIDAPTITSDRGSLLHHSAGRHPDHHSMVAGVQNHRAASGLKAGEVAGHGVCPMQPPRRCTTQDPPPSTWSPEKLPAPCGPTETFGFMTRR